MKHPIPIGRWAALHTADFWRPLKGMVSVIAEYSGVEPEAAGTLLYEGMSAGKIAHRNARPDAHDWIVTPRGAEMARQSGLKYDEHINWRDGTLNPPGGGSYPLEVYWPDVVRLLRQPDDATSLPRGRGRVPLARQSAVDAMLRDLISGKQTRPSLIALKQEALASEYGVRSRDTAVKARGEALSTFARNAGKK